MTNHEHGPIRMIRPRVWISVLVVLGLVSAHVATLQTYPLPSCDETSYDDSAYSLLTLGRSAWSVFPVPDRFGRDGWARCCYCLAAPYSWPVFIH